MKVSIELSPEYSEPYAIIYADKITDSIQRTLDIFGSNESPITAFKNENDIVILQPKEIYMVRVENKDTIIYGKEHRYRSRKRLYEERHFLLLLSYDGSSLACYESQSMPSHIEFLFCVTIKLLKNG